MQITIRHTFSSNPEIFDVTWFELVNLYKAWAEVPMKGPTPTEKPGDLPLIGFGAFDQFDYGPPKFRSLTADQVGCRRTNLNPRGLWCVAYDFDDADPEVFGRVLNNARLVTSHGLVHTTWKHGLSAGTRARIVMPCHEPGHISFSGHVTAAQWELFWWSCAKAIGTAEQLQNGEYRASQGSGLDTQTRNVERLWYLPARNLDSPFPCHVEAWGSGA